MHSLQRVPPVPEEIYRTGLKVQNGTWWKCGDMLSFSKGLSTLLVDRHTQKGTTPLSLSALVYHEKVQHPAAPVNLHGINPPLRADKGSPVSTRWQVCNRNTPCDPGPLWL